MKDYKMPECEIIALNETDVIVTSVNSGCLAQNESGTQCQMGA